MKKGKIGLALAEVIAVIILGFIISSFAKRNLVLGLDDLHCSLQHNQTQSGTDLKCQAPNITQKTCVAKISHGKNLVLKCEASGTPNAKVTWLVPFSDDSKSVTHRVEPVEGGERARLIIADFQPKHEGLYICLANNTAGKDSYECKVSLTVPSTTFATTTIPTTITRATIIPVPSTTPQSNTTSFNTSDYYTTYNSMETTTINRDLFDILKNIPLMVWIILPAGGLIVSAMVFGIICYRCKKARKRKRDEETESNISIAKDNVSEGEDDVSEGEDSTLTNTVTLVPVSHRNQETQINLMYLHKDHEAQ